MEPEEIINELQKHVGFCEEQNNKDIELLKHLETKKVPLPEVLSRVFINEKRDLERSKLDASEDLNKVDKIVKKGINKRNGDTENLCHSLNENLYDINIYSDDRDLLNAIEECVNSKFKKFRYEETYRHAFKELKSLLQEFLKCHPHKGYNDEKKNLLNRIEGVEEKYKIYYFVDEKPFDLYKKTRERLERSIQIANNLQKNRKGKPSIILDSKKSDLEEYIDLLDQIIYASNDIRKFEVIVNSLKEEDLRDFILLGLHTPPYLSATREAKNLKGKTDLKVHNTITMVNVLIAECKHNRAPNYILNHDEGLKQLYGYLSNEDIFSAFICFNSEIKNYIKKRIEYAQKIRSTFETEGKLISHQERVKDVSHSFVVKHPKNDLKQLHLEFLFLDFYMKG